jgi:hypothetical protein|tara:strand:+ start:274 stop:462 length:189 start_codon:yes stop_codon:yes gene_type:complete
MKKRRKAKKKTTKMGGPKIGEKSYPFLIEIINFFNCKEGKNMAIYLYIDKLTGKITKWKSRI